MRTTAMTPDQEADLSAWRMLALDKMPYMSTMLFSLRTLDAPGLGTFAVDKAHRLYIDFDAVRKLGSDYCGNALLHECCHLFSEHSDRAEAVAVASHEQQISNLAADAEINDDLEAAGCAHDTWVFPATIDQPENLTFEDYLHHLRSQAPPDPKGGSGDEAGQGGSGDEAFSGCGSGSGGETAPCEIGGNDTLGGTVDPGCDPVESDMIVRTTATRITRHAQSGRGTVPGGLVGRAEALLTPPKIPWRTVLSSALRRCVALKAGDFDATYTRRNRRHHQSEVLMPGRYSPDPNIAVVRDTSGSMGENELAAVVSEIEGIARAAGVRGKSLVVFDVDAAVAATQGYTGADSIADTHGGGGTDMRVGIEAATKLKPAVVVVLSDGMTPWPTDRGKVPLVICVVGDNAESYAEQAPDWATVVVVD